MQSAVPDVDHVRILVAEDSPTQAALLRFMLEEHGHTVRVAGNGRLALEALETFKPVLVISDIMMPQMNGYELCHAIKSNPETRQLPVLLLTSLSDPHDVINGLECGADYFLTKPFEETYLLNRIRSILLNSQLRTTEPSANMAVEIHFAGRRHTITADRQQILHMLLSTFEAAVRKNEELSDAQRSLIELNATLEKRVKERTESLTAEIEARARLEGERTRLLESERQALNELREANRLKDEFLALVSHELRTPLTPLLGWTRMLRGGALSPERHQEIFEVLERNLQTQAHIINDLLDFSRIVSGKMELNLKPVELAPLVQKVVFAITPSARANGVEMFLDVRDIPHPVMVDADRTHQIVWSLLSNAVKFTPRGGHVAVTLSCPPDAGGVARISVKDTGIGIQAEFVPHVFERFRQASSGMQRRFGGLGIGLSIARQLVELQGGTIEAESEGENRGATFTVDLPLKIPAHDAGQPFAGMFIPIGPSGPTVPAETGRASPLTGVKVLLVEDDSDTNDFITLLLQLSGADVTSVKSARDAYPVLETGKVDVLVSDISMPGEDGFSLIRTVRMRQDLFSRVPAIALTAHARAEDKENVLRAGFQVHMAKPAEMNMLISKVAELAGYGRS